MTVQEMLKTHPSATAAAELARCIEECYACAQTCTSCADACLAEDAVEDLKRCIRLNLDCADVCAATGAVLTRQTAFEPDVARAVLSACAELCRRCALECEKHRDHHAHCGVCAEACRRCEHACNEAVSAIA